MGIDAKDEKIEWAWCQKIFSLITHDRKFLFNVFECVRLEKIYLFLAYIILNNNIIILRSRS